MCKWEKELDLVKQTDCERKSLFKQKHCGCKKQAYAMRGVRVNPGVKMLPVRQKNWAERH